MHAKIPINQLTFAPTAPYGPPPRRAKVGSTGEIVRPPPDKKAIPRQTIKPPSVTIKAGISRYAINHPCNAPITVPIMRPRITAIIQIDQ